MADGDLRWLGLGEAKVAETLKNKALTEQLSKVAGIARALIKQAGGDSTAPLDKKGSLLYHVATKVKAQAAQHVPLLVRLVVQEKLRREDQVNAAVAYALTHAMGELREEELEREAGVGVVVSEEQIEDAVARVLATHREQLLRDRYRFPVGRILGDVRSELRWADGLYVQKELELQLRVLLGPKTEEDTQPRTKTKPVEKKEKPAEKKSESREGKEEAVLEEGAVSMEELIRTRARLHKPGENYKTEGYVVTPNTQRLLKEHLARTGGRVVTRFPPEPNGLLHIGHAKAININFAYAKAFDGICYLRFDDTNPEKEEKKFFEGIEEMVRWLGYSPYKVTYSSDHFSQLHKWAVVLIEKGLAYVCHQSTEEMRGFEQKPSPWRERPREESLRLFEDMRRGKLEEGAATLRLKLTLEEGKVDPVAYRIKFCHHERTKDAWCIYPTYDYTHCLCDSLEDITHSLCTKEFQSRRSSYYWLCNALDIYCPVQWEYGRLNVNYTVVSKRKILKLIQTKTVRDWDDPRLFTLAALRRRGVPPEALNSFVARLGLTGSQMVLDPHVLDAVVREHLNVHSRRTMAVLDPLRVTISNWATLGLPSRLSVPDFPADTASTSHEVAVAALLFIERDDFFSGEAPREFRRLARGQPVGLKHLGIVLHLEEERKGADGTTNELVVRAERPHEGNKPKAFVHWVAEPVAVQVRLYERLFVHANPEDATAVPGGFLSDCDPHSLSILHGVFVDAHVAAARVWDRFQFERIGYFSVDPDSAPGKLVFNRTVLLKEDAKK